MEKSVSEWSSFVAELLSMLHASLPALVIIVIAVLTIKLLNRRNNTVVEGHKFREQLLTLAIVLAALLGIILVLPIADSARGQVITLLGLLVTAIITLSSPTIAANALAGFMLRSLRNFSPGDFIQVGEYYGRVTEQDLFHTEIQTIDRDLLTIPNTYLASNPVKVVHASGTMISAEVSLGYDVDRHIIEEALLQAAEATKLEEAFVAITALGDYSVVYRVTGLLRQVKNLVSTRSTLRKQMLDHLHARHIEIVSPAFMNQRQVETPVLPKNVVVKQALQPSAHDDDEGTPDQLMFDKAERAQQLKDLKANYTELKESLEAIDIKAEPDTAEKLKRRMSAIERLIAYIEKLDA